VDLKFDSRRVRSSFWRASTEADVNTDRARTALHNQSPTHKREKRVWAW
jgi:hypothetical protein